MEDFNGRNELIDERKHTREEKSSGSIGEQIVELGLDLVEEVLGLLQRPGELFPVLDEHVAVQLLL